MSKKLKTKRLETLRQVAQIGVDGLSNHPEPGDEYDSARRLWYIVFDPRTMLTLIDRLIELESNKT